MGEWAACWNDGAEGMRNSKLKRIFGSKFGAGFTLAPTGHRHSLDSSFAFQSKLGVPVATRQSSSYEANRVRTRVDTQGARTVPPPIQVGSRDLDCTCVIILT